MWGVAQPRRFAALMWRVSKRYLHVGWLGLRDAQFVQVSLDGTRLGLHDILMVCVQVLTPSGKWLAMWAPPQVTIQNESKIKFKINLI